MPKRHKYKKRCVICKSELSEKSLPFVVLGIECCSIDCLGRLDNKAFFYKERVKNNEI